MKSKSVAESLADDFLEVAKDFQASVELIKVLKSRTYKIAQANVLIRAATEGANDRKDQVFALLWRQFGGADVHTAEELHGVGVHDLDGHLPVQSGRHLQREVGLSGARRADDGQRSHGGHGVQTPTK